MTMREDRDARKGWWGGGGGWGKDNKIDRRQRRAIRKRRAVREALEQVGRDKFGKEPRR